MEWTGVRVCACVWVRPAGAGVLLVCVPGSLACKCIDVVGGRDTREARRSYRAFREFVPHEGHSVLAISYSPNGSHFVVATGSAKGVVYDKDANKVVQCIKGDPYLLDMANTKAREAGCWHACVCVCGVCVFFCYRVDMRACVYVSGAVVSVGVHASVCGCLCVGVLRVTLAGICGAAPLMLVCAGPHFGPARRVLAPDGQGALDHVGGRRDRPVLAHLRPALVRRAVLRERHQTEGRAGAARGCHGWRLLRGRAAHRRGDGGRQRRLVRRRAALPERQAGRRCARRAHGRPRVWCRLQPRRHEARNARRGRHAEGACAMVACVSVCCLRVLHVFCVFV